MEVRFVRTPEIYAQADIEYQFQTILGRRERRKEHLKYSAIWVASSLVGFVVGQLLFKKPWTLESLLSLLLYCVLTTIIVVYLLTSPTLIRWMSLKSLKGYGWYLGEVRIAALPEGLRVTLPKDGWQYHWWHFVAVSETDSFVMIHGRTSITAVPKSAFETAEQCSAFVELIGGYIQASPPQTG